MRNLRSLGLAITLAVATFGFGVVANGCGGKAPPPKAPEPVASSAPAAPVVVDTDGDGIPDDVDKCPNEKEDGLPPDPKDGCPTTDPDQDGVIGDADKCPNQAGPASNNGCPLPKRVILQGFDVKITEEIMFDEDKATIKPESNKLIEEVANFLKEHKEIEYLEIAGHADLKGTDKVNKPLTNDRAKAVMESLKKLGVEETRMAAVGYSNYCPISTDKKDAAAAAKDRRVEFKILKQGGKATSIAWGGCDAAKKKGMKPGKIPGLDATPAKTDAKKAPAKTDAAKTAPAKPAPKK